MELVRAMKLFSIMIVAKNFNLFRIGHFLSYWKLIIGHVKFFVKTAIPLMFVSSEQIVLKICNFHILPSNTNTFCFYSN